MFNKRPLRPRVGNVDSVALEGRQGRISSGVGNDGSDLTEETVKNPGIVSAERFVPPMESIPKRPSVTEGSVASTVFEGQKDRNVIAFPSVRKRPRKKLYAIFAVIAVFALVMVTVVYSPLLELKTIRVTGTKLVTQEQIDGVLAPLRGKPLPQITDQSIKDLLSPVVAIKDVSIQRRPLNDVELHIQERVPVAVIGNDSGFVLVDVDGVQLSTAANRGGIDLPLINEGKALIGHDIFKVVMTVLSELPEEILKQTDYVRANTISTVELVLKDGKVIVWGDAKQGVLKSRALSILLADPRVQAEARTVDVSAPRIPVTKN